MLTLAFRNLFRHGLRTLLTLAAIVFGVAGLVLSGGFIEDVLLQLRESTIRSQIGHLQVYRAGYSAEGRRDPYKFLVQHPEQLTGAVRGWPEVTDAMLRLNFSGLANNGSADVPVLGEGVEPAPEARLGTLLTIIEGRQLQDDDAHGILLGAGVARSLKLKAGDTVTLLASTPEGAMNSLEFTIVGVFRSFSRDYDDRAVRIPLPAAQELIGSTGVHALVLSLKDTAQTDTVAARLRAQLPAAEFEVKTWYDIAEFYRKTVDLYRQQFGVLQIIILVMVLLGVANSVTMAIHERTGEFGTLMALGLRRGYVFRLVLLENTILGSVGAVLGLLVAGGVALLVARIGIPMPPPPNSDVGYTAYIRILPSILMLSFAVGWAATVLASVRPAHRASRLPIVDALRANI